VLARAHTLAANSSCPPASHPAHYSNKRDAKQ